MSNWTEEDVQRFYDGLRGDPRRDQPAVSDDNRSESVIQEECVKLLEEDGWRALRTDPVSDKSRGKGFGELGMADYLFLRPYVDMDNAGISFCNVLWVEFKARKGRLSMMQNTWHRNERARGFVTWIASVDFPASVEGFREHYAKSGLMRRARWW